MNNTANNLKSTATIIFVLQIIMYIIFAITLFAKELVLFGFILLFIGGISGWITYNLLFGFGELIEQASIIADNTTSSEKYSKFDSNKIYTNCKKCGSLIDKNPCPYCGEDN